MKRPLPPQFPLSALAAILLALAAPVLRRVRRVRRIRRRESEEREGDFPMSSRATGVRAKASASGNTARVAKSKPGQVTVEEMKRIIQEKDTELEQMKATYANAQARLDRLSAAMQNLGK